MWKEINFKGINEQQTKLIVSEVNIMRKLEDENVVKYCQRIIDKANSNIYIVMEYCEGGDLKAILDKHKQSKEPIKESFIWQVLTQMALALRA